ncbi:hypothetical protein LL3_00254 [Bacillus amyloliquefaciens LL3]|nr:hypothetical protein LL3_00254 [Bacillus amyloliquefaciens LL3]
MLFLYDGRTKAGIGGVFSSCLTASNPLNSQTADAQCI